MANSDAEGLAADGPGPLLTAWRAVKETVLAAAGFTKHGDYNGRGRGGKGTVFHTFLGHTHYSPPGNGGIKPMNPRMAAVDAPSLGSPPVPCMDFAAIPAPSFSPPTIVQKPHKPIQKKEPPIPFFDNKPVRNSSGIVPTFNVDIRFPPGRTQLLDATAVNNVQKIANFLRDNPQMRVIITVNSATDGRLPYAKYSDSDSRPAVLNALTPVNGKIGLESTLLQGRAQAIINSLMSSGIRPNQVSTKLGGNFPNAEMRKATIEFRDIK